MDRVDYILLGALGLLGWFTARTVKGAPLFGEGERYKTFIRSATGWESFSRARKRTADTGLTYDEARRACERFNNARSSAQIRKGTKMEFTRE